MDLLVDCQSPWATRSQRQRVRIIDFKPQLQHEHWCYSGQIYQISCLPDHLYPYMTPTAPHVHWYMICYPRMMMDSDRSVKIVFLPSSEDRDLPSYLVLIRGRVSQAMATETTLSSWSWYIIEQFRWGGEKTHRTNNFIWNGMYTLASSLILPIFFVFNLCIRGWTHHQIPAWN